MSNAPLAVFYPRWFPKNIGGITLDSIVIIKAKHKGNKSLLAHECVHVRQFREDRLMPLKWLFSYKHKLRYEVEAYAVSVTNGLPVSQALDSLYRLFSKHGLSRATLHKLLIEEFSK